MITAEAGGDDTDKVFPLIVARTEELLGSLEFIELS